MGTLSGQELLLAALTIFSKVALEMFKHAWDTWVNTPDRTMAPNAPNPFPSDPTIKPIPDLINKWGRV